MSYRLATLGLSDMTRMGTALRSLGAGATSIGFGGLLAGGDVFAVLMSCRVAVSRATADMFRNAATNLELALLPFDGLRTFRST